MEKTEEQQLTAAELGQIWGAYMNASANIAVFSYFKEKVEDEEIRTVLDDTLNLSKDHISSLGDFLTGNEHPLPVGFTEEDVNVDAPRLYTDGYMLQHAMQLGVLGLSATSMAISLASREDVYAFFSRQMRDYNTLHQKAIAVSKAKGAYLSPPIVPVPQEVDFVKKQSFLTGWLGERRPLLTMEIANLFSNVQRNSLGSSILTGFSQTVKSNEVRKFILRGIDIAKKHVNVFSEILEGNDVPVPMGSDAMVTNSTDIAPFSDKLIMYHTTGMIATGIAFYGMSITSNIRRDIASKYVRLTGEILLYSEDGANIMINNGWLEEPPRMVDRDELAKTNKRKG